MWREVSESRYEDMLGVLPPAMWLAKGFLVGEAHDHRTCGVLGITTATYAAFVSHEGKFYEGPPMTIAEFRQLDPRKMEVAHA